MSENNTGKEDTALFTDDDDDDGGDGDDGDDGDDDDDGDDGDGENKQSCTQFRNSSSSRRKYLEKRESAT